MFLKQNYERARGEGALLYCDAHSLIVLNCSVTGGLQHRIQLADFGTNRVRADSIR